MRGSVYSRLRLRRAAQRGNTLIETALILLPLLALVFAFVDHGLVVFLQSTFQHAVREGVRYAVTYQTAPGLSHDASIRQVVMRQSMGFLRGRENAIKIRYFDPVTLQEVPDNVPGNIIEVSIEGYQHRWLAPLWRSAAPLLVSARAADRMEGLPTGAAPPPR
ncbi:MAG: pilus assembly protein [Bryobacteraceae bacterium]|nr:pilus assembly protein [Bryobacteraceae bacterium]